MNPIFLSELQKHIEGLPGEDRQEIRLLSWVNEKEEYRKLCFELPGSALLEGERELYRRYLLAMMNNMLATFGGAKLELYCNSEDAFLRNLLEDAVQEFQADQESNNRTGYGVYLNYINRMNCLLGLGRFSIEIRDLREWPSLKPEKIYQIYAPEDERYEIELLRRAATEMEGTCLCALDVGGNSIKGVVVRNGEILVLKEHQWYPTGCKTASEMNEPLILMVRFLSACAGLAQREGELDRIRDAFSPSFCCEELLAVTEQLEREGIAAEGRFDAIAIGFPDVVVRNQIAGGETFKQLGMRTNPEIDYEVEFYKTSRLNELVAPYAKKNAPVIVLNDGNAASYITSVEQTFAPENLLDGKGMFVYTIGTEMGTGFISRGGTIQNIPLDGFHYVVDLGNEEYQNYPPSDIRSINSTVTGIPGVVQKYISQMGLFRMAVSMLYEMGDPLFEELLENGLLTFDREQDSMCAVLSPRDRRGELTRLLVSRLSEKNPAVTQAYQTMGRAMGVLIDQMNLVFPEVSTMRLLSGGIIADDRAFSCLQEGLKEYNPSYGVLRLDERTMYSPLLKSMKPEQRGFNVAIGSVYIANRFRLEIQEGQQPSRAGSRRPL